MRILVLRPEPAAVRTAGRLAALGHEAVLLPLTSAEHDIEAARTALAEPHDAIAVTSAEAARVLGGMGEESLAPYRATILFAVGNASAEAARQAGFDTILTAGGDGTDLADRIAAHCRAAGRPASSILYLAGSPHAPGFEARLRQAGIPFRTVEIYRMVPLSPTAAQTEAALLRPVPDAVLLYSRESARAFFGLAPLGSPEPFRAMRILCMSANVAAAVPPAFAAQTAVAATPAEESLLALL